MAVTSFDPVLLRQGTEIITPWIQFVLTPYPSGSSVVYRWSKDSHSDVSNYDDFKSGQVISFGHVQRMLSARDGQIASATFGFQVFDDVSPITGIGSLSRNLHDANYQFWYNRQATMKVIGSTGRLNGDAPLVLGRGYVTRYGSSSRFGFEFTCDDFLTSEFSAFNAQKKLPFRLLNTTQHSDAPATSLGLPESIVYGEVTDAPHGNNGAIPLLYAGTEVISATTWGKLIVAGHAMSEITGWHSGGVLVDPGTIGTDFLVPGFAGYPGGVKYRDIGGRRYSIIYARGPYLDNHINGTALLSCNGKGIEATGDGTGALIDDMALQYQHFLINFVFQDYMTGNWLSNPIWSPAEPTINKVNAASFTTVKNQHHARIPFPFYRGARVLGPDGQISVRDAIAELNVSNDVNAGFDKDNQFTIWTDDVISTVADYDDVQDFKAAPVVVQPDTTQIFNRIPYVYRLSQTAQQGPLSSMRICQASIDAHLADRTLDQELVLKWTRDDATALDVANHVAARYKDPTRRTVLTLGWQGTSRELGEWIRVSHDDYGWSLRTFRIEGIDIDVDLGQVSLLLRDMTATAVSATTTTGSYDSRQGQSTVFSSSGPTSAIDITTVALAFGGIDGGGQFHYGMRPTAGTYVDMDGYTDIEIDWSIFAGFQAYFRIDTMTQDAGTTVTPNMRDITAGVDHPGTAQNNTSRATTQTIIVAAPDNTKHTYRLQVTRGANTNAYVFASVQGKMAP